jgi:prepilin-type N-terminal cleavage/methylation domain-containing protein
VKRPCFIEQIKREMTICRKDVTKKFISEVTSPPHKREGEVCGFNDRIISESGVTLIELLVVVTIVGILITVSVIYFTGWIRDYNIESETKQLFADLSNAKTLAVSRNRAYFAVITANSYTIYEDTNDNDAYDAGTDLAIGPTKTPQYGLGWTGTLKFNTRGLSDSSVNIPVTLPAGASPDYSCVVVYQARIGMGGGDCVIK